MATKFCNKCQTEKPLSEFHRRGSGYQSRCKACNIAGRKEHYQNNKERTREVNRAYMERQYEWYNSLKDAPCVDCEEAFPPVCMTWDHLPGTEKVDNVANLMRDGRSRKVILEEIAKCELVCANCHAIRTSERLVRV